MLNFMKFRPVGTEMHAGGQTGGVDETNSAFAIFNAPKENAISSTFAGPFFIQLGHKPFSKS
jgi:hypothetical protein